MMTVRLRCLPPAAANAFGILALVLVLIPALVLGPACQRIPDEAAVSLRGWSLTADEVAAECARLRGPGAFDTLSVAERELFARALADREILLRLARQDGVTLERPEIRRGYRIDHERTLVREFLRHLRDRFRPAAEQEARLLPRLFRQAHIEQFIVSDAQRAEEAQRMLRAGGDFEATARRFSDVVAAGGSPAGAAPPGGASAGTAPAASVPQPKEVRVDDRHTPSQVIKAVLVDDPPGDGLLDPIRMPEATLFVRLLGFEPLAEASDSAWVEKASKALRSLVWMDRSAQWSDSLKRAAGLAFHSESYPLIAERFAALWDSIEGLRDENIAYDFLSIRAPLGRFAPEERERPLFDLWGRTRTVGEYLTSLDDVDLDHWPGSGPLAKTAQEIEGRIERLLITEEALRRGFAANPAFREALRPVEEKWTLDAYCAHATAEAGEPSPDSLAAAYQRHRNLFRFPEAVSFSVLSYPASDEARARRIHRRLVEGPAGLMAELGPSEAENHGAWYLPPTRPRDISLDPFRPEWADFWMAVRRMQPGEYALVLSAADSRWAIVRVEERRPERYRTIEEARPYLLSKIVNQEQNRIMEEILREQRRRMGLRIQRSRLAAWSAEAAVD